MLSFVPHALLYLGKSHVDLGEACSGTCRVLSDYKLKTRSSIQGKQLTVLSKPTRAFRMVSARINPGDDHTAQPISVHIKETLHCIVRQPGSVDRHQFCRICLPVQVKPPRLHDCLVTPLRLAVSFVAGSLSGCHSSKRGSGWP